MEASIHVKDQVASVEINHFDDDPEREFWCVVISAGEDSFRLFIRSENDILPWQVLSDSLS